MLVMVAVVVGVGDEVGTKEEEEELVAVIEVVGWMDVVVEVV